MTMSYQLNLKQLGQLDEPFACDALARVIRPVEVNDGWGMNGIEKCEVFHLRVGLPVRRDWGYIPPVEERILRAKLLLEEVVETIAAMGLAITAKDMVGWHSDNFGIEHREGVYYDPIEVADGLADVKVIANGTALCFGIPQDEVDYEVWASNMTKVGKDGKPIVNQEWACSYCNETGTVYIGHEYEPTACESCDGNGFTLTDPAQPVGKILKPSTYVKANIARLYVQHTSQKETES